MVFSKNKTNRKGQSGSNAAIVIIISVVVMVLYILFLPPADRQELLQGTSSSSTSSTGTASSKILLLEKPGNLSYFSSDEKSYDFPAFTINTEKKGQIIKSKSTLYVKNSVFEKIEENVDFSIDPTLSENLILSFNVAVGEGILTIELNGEKVYSGELSAGASIPVYLDSQSLSDYNTLRFSVSSPGVAFWRYNEYQLKDIKITADVTDISESQATQTITLQQKEIDRLTRARLRYDPVCIQTQVTNFEISLNNQRLFKGDPDCGVYNYIDLAKEDLAVGTNEFTFRIEKGKVLVDRLRLINSLEEAQYPIYYFEIDTSYFNRIKSNETNEPDEYELKSKYEAVVDFTFPNTDKKRFEVFINGKKMSFNTYKIKETRSVDNYLTAGTNSVEIRPLEDVTINELKIRFR